MSVQDVVGVVDNFHDMVRDKLWDHFPDNLLLGELLQLHAPQLPDGRPPACVGCDHPAGVEQSAPWPCTTYELITRTALDLAAGYDVKAMLTRALSDLEKKVSAGTKADPG